MNLVEEQRDAYLLGLMRLLFGALLVMQVHDRYEELASWGYFGAFFHLPLVPAAWVPAEGVYRALLALEAAGAVLAVVGWYGREGLLAASCIGIYLMLCDRLQYHNNRFALLLFCLLIALCPSDRSFLLFRGRSHALPLAERMAPTLFRRLVAFQVSLLYLASGGGKALDPDWRGGRTMLLRFEQGLDEAARAGASVPAWFEHALRSPVIAELASRGAISLELGLAVLLWVPRTRVLALWAGAIFHLFIQASARVELFSFLMGVAYLAFVTPEVEQRTLLVDTRSAQGRAVRELVWVLDWLRRFRVEELAPEASPAEGPVVVVERDGRRAVGRAVPGALARALPLLFPAWPLFALVAAGGGGGAASRRPGLPAEAG